MVPSGVFPFWWGKNQKKVIKCLHNVSKNAPKIVKQKIGFAFGDAWDYFQNQPKGDKAISHYQVQAIFRVLRESLEYLKKSDQFAKPEQKPEESQ